MGVEKYLVLVSRSRLTSFLFRGIELHLILQWGWNWLDFIGGVKINSIFVWGIEFDLVRGLGSELTCFLCEELKLTVVGPKLTCFQCDRLTWFLCA